MKWIKLFVMFLGAMVLIKCATFSKKEFKESYVKVVHPSKHEMNGDYLLMAIMSDNGIHEMFNDSSLRRMNLYQEIVNNDVQTLNELLKQIKINENCFVRLEWKEENILSVSLFEGERIIQNTELSGKWNKGMFYLDNSFLECNGIPYLLGGCNHNKRRLARTTSGGIIVNTAIANEGAFLFIIGAGYRMNTYKEFKRIK